MEKKEDYHLEDLAKSTNELLRDVNRTDLVETQELDSSKEKLSHESYLREFAALDAEIVPDIDGAVDIRITDDELTVLANFYPPSGNGKDIDELQVSDRLELLDVSQGIDQKAINEAIKQCNAERIQLNDVVIARGLEPRNEIPEHIVLDEIYKEKPLVENMESQTIDYREIASYTIVKNGEAVAHVVPLQEGEFGKTVKGVMIPFKKEQMRILHPMGNITIEDSRVVAACDGRFMQHENNIWINEIFEVAGDVSYKTGNINFPGDVIINGRIQDGFKVEAGGSILCKETLDASEVICKGNLSVHKGIIGRKKGKVHTGGIITTKFIENCYIEADNSIYVEKGILHSIVSTHSRLEMGRKSMIVGGKIYAQNGVVASQIGNRMGIKTELYCGINFTIEQKLAWIKDKLHAIATKLIHVENMIKHGKGDDAKLIPMRDNLKSGMHKLNEAAKALIQRLDRNEKAEVVVKETIYPGVYIEICHVSYIVPRELMWVRIWLDREKAKIIAEPLKQGGLDM